MSQHINSGEVQRVVVAELTPSELQAPSGIENMTNFEAIKWLEGILHGARDVHTSHRLLSPEAKAKITTITREKTGEEYPMAVVSVRPPQLHT